MRGKSKVWDETPTKPLQLKQRLLEAGKSMDWLAQQVTERGHKIDRVTVWCIINKNYKTKNWNECKSLIQEVLAENNISQKNIWHEWHGAEQRMGRQMPTRSFAHKFHSKKSRGYRIGEKEGDMNYTKSFLDDEVLKHFGLEDDPFYDITDFTDVWLSPRHKVLEKRVYDTIKRHGILALIGSIGAGKTTLLRHILTKMLKEKFIKVIYPERLDRTKLDGASLTQAVITQMGAARIPRSAVDRDRLAKKLLEENIKMGTHPVLILDEAHDLREEAFIALKRMWDSGMIFKLLSIILVGQGGTDAKGCQFGLKLLLEENPWIREFAERCYVVELGNLNGSMRQYLDYRFKKAGGDVSKAFEDKALHILGKKADVPQLANNIVIRAMVNAYRDGKTRITAEHVAEA